MPLANNLLTPLAKSEPIPLGLIAADSAPDAGIHKFLGSRATTLIVSNKEMRDTMKIVECLEDSAVLKKALFKQ